MIDIAGWKYDEATGVVEQGGMTLEVEDDGSIGFTVDDGDMCVAAGSIPRAVLEFLLARKRSS